MNVLILGGTGFTGPFLVRELLAQGHDVRVFHRGEHPLVLPTVPSPESAAPPQPVPGKFRKINAELFMLKTYEEVLRKLKFDVVVHMIAMTTEDAQKAVNVFADHAGRMVVASSQDVYAPFGALLGKEERTPSSLPLDESGPLRTSRYIQGGDYEKLDVEEVFLNNAWQLPVTILRMPATFGPDDARHRLFPWVKRFDDARPAILLEPAYGNFRWSHAYAENVAHAIALAVTTPHPDETPARIYNISERQTPTMGERLHEIARAAGYRGKIIVVPRDRCPPHLIKPFHVEHDLITSDAAIRRDLGYAEIVPTHEAYQRTLAWQRTVCPLEANLNEFNYAAEDALLKELGIA